MSSPLWPTALSPVADGVVAIWTCSRNTFVSQDWHLLLHMTVLGSLLPCLRSQSHQIHRAFCTVPLRDCCCSEFLFKPQASNFLLRDRLSEQAVSTFITVKVCVSSLLYCGDRRSAGVLATPDCLLKGIHYKFRSGVNQFCELQNWFHFRIPPSDICI